MTQHLTYHAQRADRDRPLAYGCHTDWPCTVQELADATADRLRTDHPEAQTGELIVWVWPSRQDEHYRQPAPAGAEEFRYPSPITETPHAPLPDEQLRDRIAAALEAADYRRDMRRGDLADSIIPVVRAELRAEAAMAKAAGYRNAADNVAEMIALHGADADAQMLLVCLQHGAELREQFAAAAPATTSATPPVGRPV